MESKISLNISVGPNSRSPLSFQGSKDHPRTSHLNEMKLYEYKFEEEGARVV